MFYELFINKRLKDTYHTAIICFISVIIHKNRTMSQ